eukprot:scaffold28272_cov101-Isochrysis_galbana.AAC.4
MGGVNAGIHCAHTPPLAHGGSGVVSYLVVLCLSREELLVDGRAGADAPSERSRLWLDAGRKCAAARLGRLLRDEVGRREVRLGGDPQVVTRA